MLDKSLDINVLEVKFSLDTIRQNSQELEQLAHECSTRYTNDTVPMNDELAKMLKHSQVINGLITSLASATQASVNLIELRKGKKS